MGCFDLPWETLRGFEHENGSIFDALKAAGHRFRLYQDKSNAFSDKPSPWWQGGWISQVASLKGLSLADIWSLGWFEGDVRARRADGSAAYAEIPYTFIEPNFGASFFPSRPNPLTSQSRGPRAMSADRRSIPRMIVTAARR